MCNFNRQYFLIIPALGDLHTSHVPLLLHVKESHCIRISEKKHAGAGIEDLVTVGRRDLLGHLVLQVLHHQAVRLVQNCKAVASDPNCRETTASLSLGSIWAA